MNMKWISRESWWIDYLEGELPKEAQEEAEWFLRHSIIDRMVVKNLKHTKLALQALSDQGVTDSEVYQQNLWRKTMAEIKALQQTAATPPRRCHQLVNRNR